MRRVPLLCGGLLALVPGGAAWWPFGPDGDNGEAQGGEALPHFAFGGMPGVVVVENHFGFDPWEDLHKNMQRAVQQSGQPLMLPGGEGGRQMAPLEDQLGGILAAFGDHHAGHFGRTGSFQVDDDHTSRFRITAELPGYKFGSDAGGSGVGMGVDAAVGVAIGADSPLSVRVVGRRSLVVSGMQQSGHMITSWQRSFSVPKGCDINNVSVTYNSASGNLTVDVPRRNITEAGAGEEADDEAGEEEAFGGPMLPPALRAMQNGLPAILGQLTGAQLQQPRRGGGFLMPAPDIPDVMEEVFGMMGQLHPRFHPPAGGEKPVPEDATVNLVGCFAESQLEKVQLKYYGDSNAASFNAMYWHARSDHVPYFAMSRHEQSIGHAFTAHGFVHESERPQWGVYDGCGVRCSDDPDRWCGCANEASRGLGNRACPTEGEKRFAVYKIGEAPRPEESNESTAEGGQGAQAKQPAATAHGRPYWQLSNAGSAGDSPSIEIVVPKGTVAQAKGREVLLFNASDPKAAQARAAPATAAPGGAGVAAGDGDAPQATVPGAEGQGGGPAAVAAAPPAAAAGAAEGAAPDRGGAAAAPALAPTPLSHTATPVGKMRLPVGVAPESCAWDAARTADDGGQVIKCHLDQGDVKSVPIKVIDEL